MLYTSIMSGVATPIELMEEERATLEAWVRKTTTEQRLVQRARIVLEAATGKATKEIAVSVQMRPATVSKWRTRFAEDRLVGLQDAPRPGKPAWYDGTTERRILAQLDEPPPEGYATWTGGLSANALGDISAIQAWSGRKGGCVSPTAKRCADTPTSTSAMGLLRSLPLWRSIVDWCMWGTSAAGVVESFWTS